MQGCLNMTVREIRELKEERLDVEPEPFGRMKKRCNTCHGCNTCH